MSHKNLSGIALEEKRANEPNKLMPADGVGCEVEGFLVVGGFCEVMGFSVGGPFLQHENGCGSNISSTPPVQTSPGIFL